MDHMNHHVQHLHGPYMVPKENKVEKAVIFLHGLGSNGQDLIQLAPYFGETIGNAAYYAPDAPFPCDMAPYGHQWFSLQDRDPHKMALGLMSAQPILDHYIDHILYDHGIEEKDLLLVGFSQGTMTSLFAGLRRPRSLAGIIGFSGAWIGVNDNAAIQKTPICLIHGEQDDVVPFAAMEDAEAELKKQGFKVETHARPNLGHSIDEEGLKAAIKFAEKCLK